MSKKSHHNRNRAVYLVKLSQMNDEELMNLGLAMPTTDSRFGAVYTELQKRKPRMMQELVDSKPPEVSEEDMQALVDGTLLNQFLDETGQREAFREMSVNTGSEEELARVVEAINERRAAQN